MICQIDALPSNISIASKYSLSSTRDDKREKTGSGNEKIMSQPLNQIIPDKSVYLASTFSLKILNTINGNNAWKIDNTKNYGYPILNGLYW